MTTRDVQRLSERTLAHYDSTADAFRAATWDHDVSQNRDALLAAIEGAGPFSLLDFGCGPGRDLVYFRSLGHAVVGLDGSARFVEMARAASDAPVWHQDFLKLELPEAHFDGIFANASLFHVPTSELARVLSQLQRSLRPRGVLFCSNPRGQDTEGFSGERYGAFHTFETWSAWVEAAGFVPISHYYRPAGKPRAEQPWLATLFQKGIQPNNPRL